MDITLSNLQSRIRQSAVTQERLAVALGYDHSLVSRILRGLRPTPEGFVERAHEMLARLEAAEQAAEAARERVLAGAAERGVPSLSQGVLTTPTARSYNGPHGGTPEDSAGG